MNPKLIRRAFVLPFIALAPFIASTVAPIPATAQTTQAKPATETRLFDGKTFANWEGDTQKTWRIEDGALVGGSLQNVVPHNEFLCTQKAFTNFDLRLKVRLRGTEGFINGGVQFRSQRIPEPAYEMSGYQADMGQGYWGSLYDESRRNRVLAPANAELMKRILKPNEWNDYRIRCEGNRVQMWFNGEIVVDYTETEPNIAQTGIIGLQVHGDGKAEAAYKDIFIRELP